MLDYQQLIAGVAGGLISTLTVHPLDLIKIRYQVNEGDGKIRPQYSSYYNCIKQIIRSRGLLGLYQGVTPNVWGATLSWGLYMMFYNAIKDSLQKDETGARKAYQHLFAGSLAGAATLAFTNPIWVAKTRLCVQYEGRDRKYRGLCHTMKLTLQEEGIRGWYKGFIPGLFGTSHGALQFMAYEELKKLYCQYKRTPIDSQLNSAVYFTFGALSKLFAAVVTYPYQVVRSRLQDHNVNYNSSLKLIKKMIRTEGWRGFYKGVIASLLRVTPATAVNLAIYEKVRYLLQTSSKTSSNSVLKQERS